MDVGTVESESATAELDLGRSPIRARPLVDPDVHLELVYRDLPGLRALILRRVGDPELAADILQDAAVTTLEKLRSGEIQQPEGVGGYLYRVALNHLRNYRRKDRSSVSSSEALGELAGGDGEPGWADVGRQQWAVTARRALEELPASRDRELLVRFYLEDEDKCSICAALGLSDEHFNRVIFRARNRFRAVLESHGFARADLPALCALGLTVLLAALTGATAPAAPNPELPNFESSAPSGPAP